MSIRPTYIVHGHDGYLPDPAEPEAPEIGDTMTFVPETDTGSIAGHTWKNMYGSGQAGGTPVTGRVVYVNRAHRWARYAWDTPWGVQHECFRY